MTMTSHRSHRRLDPASLSLMLVGLISGVLSYWLVMDRRFNPLVIVPSIVAATIGATPRHQA